MIELWQHQKDAVARAKGKPGYAFFFDPGVGKSGTVIRAICDRVNAEKRLLRTIIVTPPMVVPQFREEWLRFSKIQAGMVICLQGSGLKRERDFMHHAYDNESKAQPRVFITNYEALLMKPLYEAFQEWEPEVIVYDESHRLKNPSAARSKLAYELANPWDMKKRQAKPKPVTYLLSGTPVLNSPLDLFQQYKCMLGGFPISPGVMTENFFAFRARFFRDRNAGMPRHKYFPKWEPRTLEKDGYDAVSEINSIVQATASVAKKEECLDLPGEMSIPVKLEMTPKQRKAYEELKRRLVTYLNDRACVAQLAITKALRLMQIASGFISVEDGDENVEVNFEDTPKEQALRDLLEEITPASKVLVWAVWKHNYGVIRGVCDALGIGYVEVHGDVSEAKRRDAVERFRTDPSVRVFLGHPGSGGIGLNLTEAPYSIFYSRTFSLEHYLQARARNYRGGQTQKVTHYDLACQGTLDETVLEKLAVKEEIGASLLGSILK